jgi:hypothetical protein
VGGRRSGALARRIPTLTPNFISIGGDNIIVPGPGRDVVEGGPGDDTIIILDEWEVQPLEVIDGSFGYDTLRTPVPLAELFLSGVIVVGIDKVVVDPSQRYLSECFQ